MTAEPPPFIAKEILSLEKTLNNHILGQEAAVKEVSKVLVNSAAGFRADEKPRGIFLFTGPTGVGKTELGLTLGKAGVIYPACDRPYSGSSSPDYFPTTKILNMGEYMKDHEVAKLIGSPPGYLGHDTTPPAMEGVRKRPRTVYLLDEIEKAHPDIFDALLGPFDKGKMTTGENKELDFKDAMFVMTSNHPEPDRVLRREFMNRIDAVVKFKPLAQEHYKVLIERKLTDISTKMAAKYGYRISMDPSQVENFAALLEHQAEIQSKGRGRGFRAVGLARALQREQEALNPLVVDSANEIQPGTGARELSRIVEKSLEPVTRYVLLNGKNKIPSAADQIVIRDMFNFQADVVNKDGKVIDTIGARSRAVGR